MMNESYNEKIKEYRDNFNITYTLDDSNMFFETGYKVLQNQKTTRFIKCGKVFHNGKIKLIYDISKYRSLDSLLTEISTNNYITVIGNLLDTVEEVKNNGFMQCENIDVAFNKVFVDTNTLSIYLIYLPINSQSNASYFREFEKQLQANIVSSIQSVPRLLLNKTVKEIQRAVKDSDFTIKKLRRVLDRPIMDTGASAKSMGSPHPSERISLPSVSQELTQRMPKAGQPLHTQNNSNNRIQPAQAGYKPQEAPSVKSPEREGFAALKPVIKDGDIPGGKKTAPSQKQKGAAQKIPPPPKSGPAEKPASDQKPVQGKQPEETFFPPFVEEQKAENSSRNAKMIIICGIQFIVAALIIFVLLFVNLEMKAKFVIFCLLAMIDIVVSLLVALSDFQKKEITSVIEAEDFAKQADWSTEMDLEHGDSEAVPVTELKHDLAPREKVQAKEKVSPKAGAIEGIHAEAMLRGNSEPAPSWAEQVMQDETTSMITSDLEEESDNITVQLEDVFTPSICLVGTNTPVRVRINIDKAEFVIGKNVELADGVIQFNKAISRIHCKVSFQDNHYYITDMGSSNGTYVNGVRTTPGRLVPIAEGDSIILANSEFIIKTL